MEHQLSPFQSAVSETLAKTIRPDVQAIAAYRVNPVAVNSVKLDAMESPYALPQSLWDTITQQLRQLEVHRYPSAELTDLKSVIRTAFGIPNNLGLLFGNGSDELIHLMIQACCNAGDVVMAPTPSFVMYEVSAQFNHAHFVGVPLTADFELDLPAMLTAIETHQPKIIFLSVPNNPTGNVWQASAIEKIIAIAPGLVVIDEAYQPFLDTTYLPILQQAANVVVLRTLSKMGLAGVRFGYLIGQNPWVDAFNKVRPPYNINVLTESLVKTVLSNLSILQGHTEAIVAQRALVYEALSEQKGVQVYPSQANFFLIRFLKHEAAQIHAALKSAQILLRAFPKHPQLQDCLRVSIGTPEENQRMLVALKQALNS